VVRVIEAAAPASPARVREPERGVWRIGAVQHRWHPDPDEHREALAAGVRAAAGAGARLVCLPELTLSRYFAITGPGAGPGPDPVAEPLPGGPTHIFAAACAAEVGVPVVASCYEADPEGDRGWNTAICVAPDGTLLGRTRKLHLPVTAGYHEDRWFRPADAPGLPVRLDGVAVGLPTCWDQWFGELARHYALTGADVLVYPTAIGSEPDHPDFDTQPLWQLVMRGHAVSNGLFVVAANRVGTETCGDRSITFYGSSFVCDPYGRVLVEAPRDEPAVIVADCDLDQRRDWLELFPLLATRRPDAYGRLTQP
jgi:N-carbamoylputrescine amidase